MQANEKARLNFCESLMRLQDERWRRYMPNIQVERSCLQKEVFGWNLNGTGSGRVSNVDNLLIQGDNGENFR